MLDLQLAELELGLSSADTVTAHKAANDLFGVVPQFIAVAKAAQRIRHWHDTGRNNEGMIVSAEKVRDLWAELALLSAALPSVKEPAE